MTTRLFPTKGTSEYVDEEYGENEDEEDDGDGEDEDDGGGGGEEEGEYYEETSDKTSSTSSKLAPTTLRISSTSSTTTSSTRINYNNNNNNINNKYTTLFSSNLLEKLRNYDNKVNETSSFSLTSKKIEAKNLTILSSSGKKTLLIPFDKNAMLEFNQSNLNYLNLLNKNINASKILEPLSTVRFIGWFLFRT